jgi:hypothetical protein
MHVHHGNVLEQTNISFLRNTSKKKIQIENNKRLQRTRKEN